MKPRIEEAPPSGWKDLEVVVARVLKECGYEVDEQKRVQLARGDVNVDVWADDRAEPPNILAIECKHWNRPVSKDVVHGFRTVVGDSGANTGLLVSSAGFQSGAHEAAAYSNVRLMTWDDFQRMFALRWFKSFMSPTIAEKTSALHEYTEPINTRVSRKADALPPDSRASFVALRAKCLPLMAINSVLHPLMTDNKFSSIKTKMPTLPLRDLFQKDEDRSLLSALPDDLLDASALRPLMERLIWHSQSAVAEFDAIFGQQV